jgi:hypothetical protein
MISPASKQNISLQLNMGEGKSSVIVPLVASTLANGSNLVRVVTLKPLLNQMFQLLVNRLSGLANRPIFYVPFSRGLRMEPKKEMHPTSFHARRAHIMQNHPQRSKRMLAARSFAGRHLDEVVENPLEKEGTALIETISGLYERCVAEGGVLVVQPDHLLSQRLKHIEICLKFQGKSQEESIAHELGKLQDRLANISRDVLDESDEILHMRHQYIYSMGMPRPVDDHPHRWTTIQEVFSRLQIHAIGLHTRFPGMFDIDTTLGGFPIIHILDSAIVQRMSSLIIDDALEGRLPSFQVGALPSSIRAAAHRFMSQTEVSDVDHGLIHSHCAGTTSFSRILLLRGILMNDGGILAYALKARRWRVDYGLDPSRTLLAVPYRAKVCCVDVALSLS